MSRHNGTHRPRMILTMAAVMFVVALTACAGVIYWNHGSARAEVSDGNPGYDVVYSAENPIPEIAERVRPAVVQVISKKETWTSQGGVETVDIGYGSGVYFDERGYIVTNYHVIEGATAVDIQMLDGTVIPVDEFFYDDSTDLAVLKVGQKLNATPVVLGDSDQLKIGELVIAIGNPGVENSVFPGTVTAGIVSALDRQDINANNFTRQVNVIQTDAAINSGNSGGALLNARGEMVGIPTLKITTSYYGTYEGLGFAIPSNLVKTITADLIANGKVLRPRMGVMVADVAGPDEALKSYPPAGIRIESVETGSPAEEAGLKRYDIITQVDDVRVMTFISMTAELDKHAVGDRVKLTVYRYYDAVTGIAVKEPEKLEMEVELKILDE